MMTFPTKPPPSTHMFPQEKRNFDIERDHFATEEAPRLPSTSNPFHQRSASSSPNPFLSPAATQPANYSRNGSPDPSTLHPANEVEFPPPYSPTNEPSIASHHSGSSGSSSSALPSLPYLAGQPEAAYGRSSMQGYESERAIPGQYPRYPQYPQYPSFDRTLGPPSRVHPSQAQQNMGSISSPPILIPQRRPGDLHRGFARAYPPVLTSVDIDEQTWFYFLDAYNKSLEMSPEAQMIQLGSSAVGIIPGGPISMIGEFCTILAHSFQLYTIAHCLMD